MIELALFFGSFKQKFGVWPKKALLRQVLMLLLGQMTEMSQRNIEQEKKIDPTWWRAFQGRRGVEFVINQLCEEVERLSTPAIEGVQSMAATTMKDLSNVQQSIEGIGKKWEENLHEELQEFIKEPSLITGAPSN